MIRAIAFCLVVLCATGLAAQQRTSNGTGATVRALDKLTGIVEDVQIPSNGSAAVGRIEIALEQCRYPEGNLAGDAYAYLTVREFGVAEPVFRGWMVGSSPALNAMDHQRYDVWVLRCTTS